MPRVRENLMNAIMKESASILYTISKCTAQVAIQVN